MKPQIIKVCGMRYWQNIKDLEMTNCNLMGFIFYKKSPRYVSELPQYMPTKQKRVGVFVNEEINAVINKVIEFKLDFVQLHSNESYEYCKELFESLAKKNLNTQIIKVFSIYRDTDFKECNGYLKYCKYFLFDTKCDVYGGSGESFNWNILDNYKADVPFILSGGIGPDFIEAIRNFKHPKCVGIDINSKFEISAAFKDCRKIETFINELAKL